jgi:hypothetical protein
MGVKVDLLGWMVPATAAVRFVVALNLGVEVQRATIIRDRDDSRVARTSTVRHELQVLARPPLGTTPEPALDLEEPDRRLVVAVHRVDGEGASMRDVTASTSQLMRLIDHYSL